MSIALDKYVRIISGVGGGAGVRQRDLIGRIFTSSPLVSPDTVLEFSSAGNVALYFGTTSEEYRRALMYFGYVSPSIASPRRINFARYAKDGTGAAVIGNNDAKSLVALKAINAGALAIAVGNAAPINVANLNLSAATTLAGVATILQTAIRAANAALNTAVVDYAANGANRFSLTLPGQLGKLAVTSTLAGIQDAASVLGWNAATNALNVTGVAAQSPVDAFLASTEISDNFGSFVFADALTLDQTVAIANLNDTYNVKFMFMVPVTRATAVDWSAALSGLAGTGLTLTDGLETQFPEQIPMVIEAATDYTKRNAVQNYMYRQFGGMVSQVTGTADSNFFDALRINYYGQTATAGQKIDFYQRGVLMGGSTDPVDMNVFANEAWLKDYAASELLSLQLSISRIPANTEGKGLILNILQPVIDQALFNGVISVGKELTPVQKVFIIQTTGDELAWRKVQDVGYVLDLNIQSYTTTDSRTEYKAVYSLIYSKDDAIRVIEGTHSLV